MNNTNLFSLIHGFPFYAEAIEKLLKVSAPHINGEFALEVNGIIEDLKKNYDNFKNVKEYNAEFLYPSEDPIDQAGYEFANANTELYQKECWENLVDTIKNSEEKEKK